MVEIKVDLPQISNTLIISKLDNFSLTLNTNINFDDKKTNKKSKASNLSLLKNDSNKNKFSHLTLGLDPRRHTPRQTNFRHCRSN